MEFLKVLEGIRNPFLDVIFRVFTEIAGEMVLLAILCVLYWCVSKKISYVMGFAFMGSQMVVNNLKLTFRIERPWILDPTLNVSESLKAGATGYSFPSGHTCAAGSLYGALAFKLRGIAWKIAALVIVIGVMFSRMYFGVHTPLDVCVAFVVTAFVVALCIIIDSKVEMTDSRRLALCIIFGVLAIASVVYAVVLTSTGTVEAANAADSSKMSGAALAFVISWFVEVKYINFNERGCKLPMQIVKVLIGVAGVLAIRTGLKELFKLIGGGSEPLICGGIRYFFVVLFAMTFYPMVIKRFFTDKDKQQPAE